ncbi:hypothetical protein EDD85DRAFT_392166 [Armillaria nabsnona]|nr:hypothetical protein EDD85DRAFT_392166 [Armillaria nabsnona]
MWRTTLPPVSVNNKYSVLPAYHQSSFVLFSALHSTSGASLMVNSRTEASLKGPLGLRYRSSCHATHFGSILRVWLLQMEVFGANQISLQTFRARTFTKPLSSSSFRCYGPPILCLEAYLLREPRIPGHRFRLNSISARLYRSITGRILLNASTRALQRQDSIIWKHQTP